MANQLSKICRRSLPGDLFQTAISENRLAIESRKNEDVFFTVMDLKSGELLFEGQIPEVTPWHSLAKIDSGHIVLQYFENKKNPDSKSYWSYDWKKGDWKSVDPTEQAMPVSTPDWIPADAHEFQIIKQFTGTNAVLGSEYLELGSLIVLNYYHNNESLERSILVLKNGNNVLHEVQDTKLKGFSLGGFFATQNRLIFAREKNEVHVYEI